MNLPLLDGRVAVVDAEDFPQLAKYRWGLNGKYVKRSVAGRSLYLHRFIMGLKPGDGKEVDHINHNPLDNRRCNLRIVSHAENLRNRNPRSKTRSNTGILGVFREGRSGRYVAYFTDKGHYYNLGRFDTVEEATEARRAFECFATVMSELDSLDRQLAAQIQAEFDALSAQPVSQASAPTKAAAIKALEEAASTFATEVAAIDRDFEQVVRDCVKVA